MKTLDDDLTAQYQRRFAETHAYRDEVWKILTSDFFADTIPRTAAVLDLGCGWGEFINNIDAATKYGMDLNPECRDRLDPEVNFLEQSCAEPWPVAEGSLDVVFTSNFFEHLPSKESLVRTFEQAYRSLRPGGQIVCVGPNIKHLPGLYWDFFDHYLPLTEVSLAEGLELRGFRVTRAVARFLPYTMVGARQPPLAFVRAYLKLPLVWRFLGRQFLVQAVRPA